MPNAITRILRSGRDRQKRKSDYGRMNGQRDAMPLTLKIAGPQVRNQAAYGSWKKQEN